MEETIYLIDELEIRDGMTDAFLAAFGDQYLPAAKERGMDLIHTWLTPPEGPPGTNSTILLVWGLEGIAGFWRMRSQNGTPEIAEWWSDCDRYCVSRTRRFAVAPESSSAFSAAGRVHA